MNVRHSILIAVLVLACGACREPNVPVDGAAAPAATPAAVAGGASAPAAAPVASAYAAETPFAADTLCNIEFLGDQAFGSPALVLSEPAQLRGWLGDGQGGTPASVELRFANADDFVQAQLPVRLGEPRDDVVSAFPGKSGLANSGFSIAMDPSVLPAGTWHVYLVYTGNGTPKACDNGRTITVAMP